MECLVNRTLAAFGAVLLGLTLALGPGAAASAEPGVPTPGTSLWLSGGTGMSQANGKLSSWEDQSGNGRHATMPVAERQPTYVKWGIGLKPTVRFLGAQSLNLASSLNPTTYTILVVGKQQPASSFNFGIILGPGGSNPNNQLRWNGDSGVMTVRTGGNPMIITAPSGNNRTYHMLTVTFDGSTQRLYRNGVLTATSAVSSTMPFAVSSVGSYYSTSFLQGDISELMVYDRVLSPTERSDTETYLNNKYFFI